MGELAVWTFSLQIQCHAALATFMSQGVAEAQPQSRIWTLGVCVRSCHVRVRVASETSSRWCRSLHP